MAANSPKKRTPAGRPAAAKPAAAKPAAKNPTRGPTPALEWIAACLGLAALLLILGVVAAQAFRPDDTPPQVTVERLAITRTAAGYLVEIRATNRGGSPVSQVVVEGELSTSSAEPQTAEATFDFIADHSSSEGGLFFTQDPGEGVLTLRAKGYAAP